MGRAVYEASARARAVFEEADRILGYKLSEICFNGPADRLDDTRVAQPAILTTSVALLEALAEDSASLGGRISDGQEPRGVAALPDELRPAFVAGHSLGEFSALVAAGVLTFSDALRLVTERGRLAATKGARGAMAAVIGMSAADVDRIISETVPQGTAVVANDNGPSQVTIAGDDDAVAKVSAALSRQGARKVVPLRISGPFHFPAMGAIGGDLASFLRTIKVLQPVLPVFSYTNRAPPQFSPPTPYPLAWHPSPLDQWGPSPRVHYRCRAYHLLDRDQHRVA